MNPKPSLVQCLVLHDIADDGVWFDVTTSRWHSQHLRKDVTVQVELLHRDGYIWLGHEVVPDLVLTLSGLQVLARRALSEVLEKVNGPG